MKERNVSKLMGQAINDYNMIKAGDRILVAISGGVDSIALASLLAFRRNIIPIDYEMHFVMIDSFNGESEEYNTRIDSVRNFIKKKTGQELEIYPMRLVEYLVDGDNKPKQKNICFKCAQIRRSTLFKIATEKKCNKVALGHHKDDIVETLLMNIFYKRELAAMLPRLPIFNGEMEIIRPLAYFAKGQIINYCKFIEAPIYDAVCPAQLVKHELLREETRELVKRLSKEIPNFKNNVFAAFRNPKEDYLLNRLFDPSGSGLFKRP